MEKVGRIEVLKKYIDKYSLSNIFDDHSIEEIELHRYEADEMILIENSERNYFYILVEGRARVSPSSEEGKFVLLDYLQPIDILGDIEYIFNDKYYHNVKALVKTTLIAIPIKTLESYLSNNIYFYKFICERMACKIRSTSIKYSRALLYPLKSRLAKYFYDLADGTNGAIKVKFKQTAEYFGISPRHLRRIVVELEETGIIKRSNGKIIVLDSERLKDEASYL
ncbi:cyclic nucleotide-binding domain-containing protein [Wukongibacter baidiensis]|uniref:Crp/Fnr family transcriptional regulator n=1 Tax=Wukongibacter baidiensis TaxID=1723361 RepID=UPI003D7FC2A4